MRCRQVGCTELVRGHYCVRHLHTNDRSTKGTDPFYISTAWQKLRKFLRARNPVCQRIVNGARCHEPSYLVHHLRGIHAASELRLDPSNLVCLCRAHHPDYDTPDWQVSVDYAPTESSVTL